jgi:hypothetical protein
VAHYCFVVEFYVFTEIGASSKTDGNEFPQTWLILVKRSFSASIFIFSNCLVLFVFYVVSFIEWISFASMRILYMKSLTSASVSLSDSSVSYVRSKGWLYVFYDYCFCCDLGFLHLTRFCLGRSHLIYLILLDKILRRMTVKAPERYRYMSVAICCWFMKW